MKEILEAVLIEAAKLKTFHKFVECRISEDKESIECMDNSEDVVYCSFPINELVTEILEY